MVQPFFSCASSHSIEPGWGTVWWQLARELDNLRHFQQLKRAGQKFAPRQLQPALTASSRQRCSRPSSLSGLGSSFLHGWRSMPGSIPETSQLDWLISTTAMIVLSWSRATRDLLKSFGWASGHSIISYSDDGAISLPPAPYHLSAGGKEDSNPRSPVYG